MERLDNSIEKWYAGCQQAVDELKMHWDNNPQACHMLASLLMSFEIEPEDFGLELLPQQTETCSDPGASDE